MKRSPVPLVTFLWIVSILLSPVSGQTQTRAAGHWEGSIDVRTKKLEIVIDLAQRPDAGWIATIGLPARGLTNYPLNDVSVEGDKITFAMRDAKGTPLFKGTFAESGSVIVGDFIQAGHTFPFRLERRGRENFQQALQQTYGETPNKGTPGHGLVGVWQGTLDSTYLLRELTPAAPDTETGASLRIILKVTQGDNGTHATLGSPDQNVAGQPAEILLKGQSVTLEQKNTHSFFRGRMSSDESEIEGEWTNGEWTLPLTFKRLPKKD
jgi:hypothetical protein